MKNRILLSAWAVLVSGSPAFAQNPVFNFDGPITAKSVPAIEQQLLSAPPGVQLHLMSGGGDGRLAFELADFLNAHDIELDVSNYCLSACGQILVLAVNKVTIEPGTIFLFHSTITSRYFVVKKTHPKYAEKTWGDLVLREEELYKKRGIPTPLLYLTSAKMRPLCGAFFKDTNGNVIDYVIKFKYSFYLPTARLLHAYGIDVPGDDAQIPAEIQQRIGPRMARQTGVLGVPNDETRTLADLLPALGPLPECPKDSLPAVDPDAALR